jgi:hypothetical protein
MAVCQHVSPHTSSSFSMYMQEGERAFEHFKTVQSSGGLEKAVYHKDKLLNFDQTRSPYRVFFSASRLLKRKCVAPVPLE